MPGLNRRTFFSRLFGTAAAAVATGAAGASILARGTSGAPAAVLPDPLDARHWGKAETRPIKFYDGRERAPHFTIGGVPVRVSPAVPPNEMFFLAASGMYALRPGEHDVRLVNLAAPAREYRGSDGSVLGRRWF